MVFALGPALCHQVRNRCFRFGPRQLVQGAGRQGATVCRSRKERGHVAAGPAEDSLQFGCGGPWLAAAFAAAASQPTRLHHFEPPELGRGLSVRTSPCGWRSPERLLEGAGKSGLGTVTDQVGNLRKGCAGIAELLGRDLHAPIGDVVHRRHADQTNEAVGQRRTRQADLTAKVIHVPRPGDVVM